MFLNLLFLKVINLVLGPWCFPSFQPGDPFLPQLLSALHSPDSQDQLGKELGKLAEALPLLS